MASLRERALSAEMDLSKQRSPFLPALVGTPPEADTNHCHRGKKDDDQYKLCGVHARSDASREPRNGNGDRKRGRVFVRTSMIVPSGWMRTQFGMCGWMREMTAPGR